MWSSDDRWIRGVAALEPTYVASEEAAVALTWLAVSPDDVEVCVEGRCRRSAAFDEDAHFDPSASLVFADGTRLGVESFRGGGGGVSAGHIERTRVFAPVPGVDLAAVELVWQAFDLQATLPLPPATLRDAMARAVPRG
jgi:hypothetical protein